MLERTQAGMTAAPATEAVASRRMECVDGCYRRVTGVPLGMRSANALSGRRVL